jgi:uncharacterized protein (TIRG00374 family)
MPAGADRRPPDGAGDAAGVQVSDHLDARIRLPADRLRCFIALAEIALLAGLGLLATATATGVNLTVLGASHHLPRTLLALIRFVAPMTFAVLPLALAVRLCLLRRFRRLAEAVVIGAIATGVVSLLNVLLTQPVPVLHRLHAALHPGAVPGPTVDGYLAGLVAYVTVVGLSGRPHWRTAFLAMITFYALASLTASPTTVLALLITLALGSAIGSGLRYAAGSVSVRPGGAQIAQALQAAGLPLRSLSRVSSGGTEVRKYAAVTVPGQRLELVVYDRDQQSAELLYRLYRRLRLKRDVSRTAPLTMEGAIEREALLNYAVRDAGVPTPPLRAVIRVGPDTAVLARDYQPGTTLRDSLPPPTAAQLRQVWDTVLRLHAHRVTHRALTADRILLTSPDGAGAPPGRALGPASPPAADPPSGEVVLLEPGSGDIAATDLQIRLDLAQLSAETALLVGPELAADLATEMVGKDGLLALVPLLQPVALHRSTRAALRRRRELLPALRRRLLASAPDAEVAQARLERIRPRTMFTLIAGLLGAYLVAGQLTGVDFRKLLSHASPGWTLTALALSAVTYLGATWSLSGFVLERLRPLRTFLVQVAASFVTLVTPAAVGGVALNLRYLRRSRVRPADAAASVGVAQLMSLFSYVLLVVIFAAITGVSGGRALRPLKWALLAVAALVVILLIVLVIPAARRQLRARLASAAQVIPRLMEVVLRPRKLIQGVGGTLVISLAYILCLAASVRALGGSAPLASLAVVFLTSSAAGSVAPTPGGLGVVETAMGTGLTAVGLHPGTAFAVVLLFRTLTFWLPVPIGWLSLRYLQHREVL